MNKKQVEEKVLNFFRQKGIQIEEYPDVEKIRYLDQGWLDSFDLIDFITYLESEFEIEIPPEELQRDEFRTVGGVVNTVLRLKNKL